MRVRNRQVKSPRITVHPSIINDQIYTNKFQANIRRSVLVVDVLPHPIPYCPAPVFHASTPHKPPCQQLPPSSLPPGKANA